jgi:hypothetical protein
MTALRTNEFVRWGGKISCPLGPDILTAPHCDRYRYLIYYYLLLPYTAVTATTGSSGNTNLLFKFVRLHGLTKVGRRKKKKTELSLLQTLEDN